MQIVIIVVWPKIVNICQTSWTEARKTTQAADGSQLLHLRNLENSSLQSCSQLRAKYDFNQPLEVGLGQNFLSNWLLKPDVDHNLKS